MVLAKPARMKPRDIAERLKAKLEARRTISPKSTSRARAFSTSPSSREFWHGLVRDDPEEGATFGAGGLGKGEKVNVEYVSANPTGPMHVGHCRGAVFGDALANLLAFAGYDVTREYYINDAGGQVDVLARRRSCATARRWARTSAPFRKACIRATT